MDKKIFKILSIDFDFFPNTTSEMLAHYPDGIDLSTELTKIIWASHYATSNGALNNIDINKSLYKELKYILNSQSTKTPVLITNSHVHAFNFIEQHFDNKQIALTNIDWHHDIINDNSKIDCGNWIKFLKEKYPDTVLKWITRPESIDCYGITNSELVQMNIEFDFSSIEHTQFDAIFLCRSDSWTPPHLDKYFDELIKECFSVYFNVKIEDCVTEPRDLTEIDCIINDIKSINERKTNIMTITKEAYIITANENGEKQYLLDEYGHFANEYYMRDSSQYKPKEFKSKASALKWYKQHLKYNDGSCPYMPKWYPLNKINIEKIIYTATI